MYTYIPVICLMLLSIADMYMQRERQRERESRNFTGTRYTLGAVANCSEDTNLNLPVSETSMQTDCQRASARPTIACEHVLDAENVPAADRGRPATS